MFNIFFPVGPWFFTGMITNKNYQGRVNVTATGKPCQRWDAQTPHTHDWVDADFPEGSLEEAADFCRYLGDVIRPWCYTLTGTNWEYCSVQDIVCRRYQSQDLWWVDYRYIHFFILEKLLHHDFIIMLGIYTHTHIYIYIYILRSLVYRDVVDNHVSLG